MGVQPSDLAGLSVDEKLELISELWDSIAASSAVLALSDTQQAELRARRARGFADPAATTVDWVTVRERLFGKS